MSRHGNTGLQMIMERRAREESSKYFYEADRADTIIRQRADFENRTFSRYQAGEIKRRAKQRAEESNLKIQERRQKLAQLIKREEDIYSEELAGCIETPRKRRLRLMENLKVLQDKRQQEHDEYVRMKNEQGWRDSCDPLRHQISEALEKQVIAERNKQVIENDIRRNAEDVDELNYIKTVQENTKAFYEEKRKEQEEKKRKIELNRTTWLAEIQSHQERAAREKQKEYEESLEFRTTTEAAIKQAQEAAELKARQQAERRKELDELNTQQITKRECLLIKIEQLIQCMQRKLQKN